MNKLLAKPTMIRGLSFTQPYAWCMFHGKDVENRGNASKNHRGPLAIVASMSATRKDWSEHVRAIGTIEPSLEAALPTFYRAIRGGLIGAVEVHGVAPPYESGLRKWHFQGKYGLLCRNATELPFREMKGHQGLLRVQLTAFEAGLLERGRVLRVLTCKLCGERSYAHEWKVTKSTCQPPNHKAHIGVCPLCEGSWNAETMGLLY